jgi:hypothetical protein
LAFGSKNESQDNPFTQVYMIRTKSTAAANEEKDILHIITSINTKNAVGQKIIDRFLHTFGYELLKARERQGSSRGTHYDFDIEVRTPEGDVWKHVEHKGSKTYRIIKAEEKPWTAGVQFHNGGSEKYTITKEYARLHYDTHIASGSLKRTFNIQSPIPSFEEWFKQDCCVQDNPRTSFGKELKERVREQRNSSLLAERTPVVAGLKFDEEEKKILIAEVLPIANHALEQKDYWLTICGDIEKEFNLAWSPKFTIPAIEEIVIHRKKDITFDFKCSGFAFSGILRWGKGAGFSCLRLDLK